MTRRRSTQHVNTAKKLLIHIGDVGGDPIWCRSCNQKGHVEKVCKRKQQGTQIAEETDDAKEKRCFVSTCFANNITSEAWLINSGCTYHTIYDKGMFVNLDETYYSKVKIGNGDYIKVKGLGDIVINTGSEQELSQMFCMFLRLIKIC